MNEKILITGSAGVVGSHLVEHILENTDWEIIGLIAFSLKATQYAWGIIRGINNPLVNWRPPFLKG